MSGVISADLNYRDYGSEVEERERERYLNGVHPETLNLSRSASGASRGRRKIGNAGSGPWYLGFLLQTYINMYIIVGQVLGRF